MQNYMFLMIEQISHHCFKYFISIWNKEKLKRMLYFFHFLHDHENPAPPPLECSFNNASNSATSSASSAALSSGVVASPCPFTSCFLFQSLNQSGTTSSDRRPYERPGYFDRFSRFCLNVASSACTSSTVCTPLSFQSCKILLT